MSKFKFMKIRFVLLDKPIYVTFLTHIVGPFSHFLLYFDPLNKIPHNIFADLLRNLYLLLEISTVMVCQRINANGEKISILQGCL